MTPVRRLPAAIALGLALTLTAACGGDDGPEAIPDPTSSPTPEVSVSPPPADTPDLDAEQQAAFDSATARHAEFEAFTARVAADPEGSQAQAQATVDELFTYTLEPATSDWGDALDQLVADGIRIEGRSKVEWTAPVEVTDDKVVFLQCESPGDWVAYQGDASSTQENNIVTEVTMLFREGQWRIQNQESDGEC